jgi:hypothetical protein
MSEHENPAECQSESSSLDAPEFAQLLRTLIENELPFLDKKFVPKAIPLGGAQKTDTRAVLVAKARALFSERKRRAQYFSPIMFGETGWDLLLGLYITDFVGGQQTTGSLVSWIDEPLTSALRWINYLEKERLISREPHPRDRRAVLIAITEKGRQKLDDYFSTLPIALSG